MFVPMEQERNEVYERIPWEALEQRRRDPSRLVIAAACAVALGALAFAFTRDQAVPPAPPPVSVDSAPSPTSPPVPSSTMTTPLVLAEADLYAVDTERLLDVAAAHAEWFALEYVSVDGSEASRIVLSGLLPAGVPLPEASEGTQVYADWVRAVSVTEVAPLLFEVEVMVRSLASSAEGVFVRQAPRRLTVEVAVGADGSPRVTRPPTEVTATGPTPQALALGVVPETIRFELEATMGAVVGGEPLADGRWRVVVMAADPDGVTRPRTVVVP